MGKTSFLLFFLLCTLLSKAQINEFGIFLGGSNYIGDVGPTNYINPNEISFGLLYKWNKSTRHSWRVSYIRTNLSSSDLDSKVVSRNERGFSFSNTINEFSAGLEFNFFEFDLHQLDNQFTPYVYTGLSYFTYDELFYNTSTRASVDENESSLAIPMIIGIKTKIARSFVIGLEVGARYTFTDNLDGSAPKNSNLQNLQFGNLNSQDWYVFTGLTLTYTFGENPCFCPE